MGGQIRGIKNNPVLFISALVPPELRIKSSDARTQEKLKFVLQPIPSKTGCICSKELKMTWHALLDPAAGR